MGINFCRLKDRGFEVEHKIARRTGKASYKPGAPKTCGWLYTPSAGVRHSGGERRKRQDTTEREREDGAEPVAAVFSQEALKFSVFYDIWKSVLPLNVKRART